MRPECIFLLERERTIQWYVNSMLKVQSRHVNNVYFPDSGINEVDRQTDRQTDLGLSSLPSFAHLLTKCFFPHLVFV